MLLRVLRPSRGPCARLSCSSRVAAARGRLLLLASRSGSAFVCVVFPREVIWKSWFMAKTLLTSMKRNPTGQQNWATRLTLSHEAVPTERHVNVNMNSTRVQNEVARCLETEPPVETPSLQGVAVSGSGVAPRRRAGGTGGSGLPWPESRARDTVSHCEARGSPCALPGFATCRLGRPGQAPRASCPVSFPSHPTSGGLRAPWRWHRSCTAPRALLMARGRGPEGPAIRWATWVLQDKPRVSPHAHPQSPLCPPGDTAQVRGQDVTSFRPFAATTPEGQESSDFRKV